MATTTMTSDGSLATFVEDGASINNLVTGICNESNDNVANPNQQIQYKFQFTKPGNQNGKFVLELLDKNGDVFHSKSGRIGNQSGDIAISVIGDENVASIVNDSFVKGDVATFSTGTFNLSLRGKISGLKVNCTMIVQNSGNPETTCLSFDIANNGLVEANLPFTYAEA